MPGGKQQAATEQLSGLGLEEDDAERATGLASQLRPELETRFGLDSRRGQR